MEIKVSQIKTVKCYIDTLRDFRVGEEKYFKLVDTDYTAFHNARRRLHERKSGVYTFEKFENEGKRYFRITRTE